MKKQSKSKKIKVGISVGDINGVGLEIILKTFNDGRILDMCTPVVFCSNRAASFYRKILNFKNFNIHSIDSAEEVRAKKFNVVNCWQDEFKIEPGKADKIGGKYALLSLQAACEALKNGEVDVLVTAPINKHTIQSEDFDFPGHTEYLQNYFGADESLMFMVSDDLKIGVATGHIPLDQVSSKLNSDLIRKKLDLMAGSLKKDYMINKPKIAVLSVNPHAGDKGLIGDEDDKIVAPTIQKAQEDGALVFGPFSADSFFGNGMYKNFDAVLAMYHDQGLIPFKTISFSNGVNFTAGLPIIRTSPDHGSAHEIAGTNQANENSFRQAVYAAIDLFNNRNEQAELGSNPLKTESKMLQKQNRGKDPQKKKPRFPKEDTDRTNPQEESSPEKKESIQKQEKSPEQPAKDDNAETSTTE
jgi:4-hydroxythreonine-4-phosphate dehydrogenase